MKKITYPPWIATGMLAASLLLPCLSRWRRRRIQRLRRGWSKHAPSLMTGLWGLLGLAGLLGLTGWGAAARMYAALRTP